MSRSWVVIAACIAAAAPVRAQPRPGGIVELRQDLQALQAQIGMMLGQDGQRDVQLADLARRVEELADRAASAEMVQRTAADDGLTAVRSELAAGLTQLRAELDAFATTTPTQVDHVGGFVWTTDDEDYQLRVAGYLQARLGVDLESPRMPDAESTAEGGFSLRRARVILDGIGESDVGFRIVADLADPAVVDAYLEWAWGPFAVRVGRDRVPYTRSSIIAEHRLAFAERAVVADALSWDRDIGLQLHVRTRRVGAQVAVGNGGPSDSPEVAFAGAPLVAIRQEYALAGALPDAGAGDFARTRRAALTLGAGIVVDPVIAPRTIGPISLVTDVDGDGSDDRIFVLGAGIDLTLRRRGLELALEGMYRVENWGDLLLVNPELAAALGSSDPTRSHVAGAVEATYVTRGVILAGVRFAYGDLPVLSMRGPSAIPPSERAVEIGVSAAVYRKGMRFLGLTHRALITGERMEDGTRPFEQSIVLELQGVL